MAPTNSADAVTRYLFNHRQDLMTDEERQAFSVTLWREKAHHADGAMQRLLLARAAAKSTAATAALLQDGVEAFRARVCERILREVGDAVLNRCPRCQSLCNTPRARQCPVCFHDWH